MAACGEWIEAVWIAAACAEWIVAAWIEAACEEWIEAACVAWIVAACGEWIVAACVAWIAAVCVAWIEAACGEWIAVVCVEIGPAVFSILGTAGGEQRGDLNTTTSSNTTSLQTMSSLGTSLWQDPHQEIKNIN